MGRIITPEIYHMSHDCSTALVRCMDFRLESVTENYLKSKNLINDCDIISIAGVAKNLIENPNGFLASQIDISKRLHNIKTLIIMHHMDCGGYGGHDAFENTETERAFQIEQMQKAGQILKSKYPDLKVVLALADIDGNNKASIKDIN